MLISSKLLNTAIVAIAITAMVIVIGVVLDGEVVPKPVHVNSLIGIAPEQSDLSEKSAPNIVNEFQLPESPVTEKDQQQREESIKKADELIKQMNTLIAQQDLPVMSVEKSVQSNKRISDLLTKITELKETASR